jgi:hypothetical protein
MMPDFSMCQSTTCRLREACERNEASGTKPSARRQAYATWGDDTDRSPCPAFSGDAIKAAMLMRRQRLVREVARGD